ncbi:hypothetical protein [Asticcacaulis solisilvae]|uniref:hypothetical protein n=1 Tax=Asticcacaulis solisilvae TaxID=1217274 RepID=UPI003FD87124
MPHMINGIIGTVEVVQEIATLTWEAPLIQLHHGMAIIGVAEPETLRRARDYLALPDVREGFLYIRPELEGIFAELGRRLAFAYIETLYHGGTGVQTAAIYIPGHEPVFMAEPEFAEEVGHCSPINTAIRALGITADPGLDEFDTLGLSHIRSLGGLGLLEVDDDD